MKYLLLILLLVVSGCTVRDQPPVELASTAPEPVAEPTPQPVAEPVIVDRQVRLMCLGDVLPLEDRDYLSRIRPVLHLADFGMFNLEAPLSTRGQVTPLKFRRGRLIYNEFLFRTSPEHATRFADSNLHLAVMANNHIMDYGAPALLDTFDLLQSAGLGYTGAGRNANEARTAAVTDLGGCRVAVLAYVAADTLPGTAHFAATAEKPGTVFVHEGKDQRPTAATSQMLKEDLARARQVADVIIVSYHWGLERHSTPTTFQRQLAHQTVDYGADLIVGHHPHVPQGVEIYHGRPIVYSLGNFVFPTRHRGLEQQIMLEMVMRRCGWESLVVWPIICQRPSGVPVVATGSRGRRILANAAALSRKWGTPLGLAQRRGHSVLVAQQGALGNLDERRVREESFYIVQTPNLPKMRTVHFLAWDFENGVKVSKKRHVTVHQSLAEEVRQIFREIYHDPGRFPIHDIVGYNYRTVAGGTGMSRHAYGRAIDLNRAENPVVCAGEKIVHPKEPPYVPKAYRPGEDPFSIPRQSIVVKAFKRRGWTWGGDFSRCVDHQHFDKR
ncbi:MAG: CapA family protein [Armatimonadota bacterium]